MSTWKDKFDPSVLDRGKAHFLNGKIAELTKYADDKYRASFLGKERYDMSVSLKNGRPVRISCKCPVAKGRNFCEHMAAMLYALEADQKLSPEKSRPKKTPDAEPAQEDAYQTLLPERGDHQQQREDSPLPEAGGEAPSLENTAVLEHYHYFDGEKILQSLELSKETLQKGEKLLAQENIKIVKLRSGYNIFGNFNVTGHIKATGKELKGRGTFGIELSFEKDRVVQSDCTCPVCRKSRTLWYTHNSSCAYVAGVLTYLKDYLSKNPLGDATDQKASRLLDGFRSQRLHRLTAEQFSMEGSLRLVPRIIRKSKELLLSFRIGADKLFVVKALDDFYFHVKNSETATYGNHTEINHQRSNFQESSLCWLDFLCHCVQEEIQLRNHLINSHYYGSSIKSSMGDSIILFSSRLDDCYKLLLQLGSVEYENRDVSVKKKTQLTMAEGTPKVRMSISPVTDEEQFHGIQVEGSIPDLYYGERASYYIHEDQFCRVEKDFSSRIRPIAAYSSNGHFSFTIGRNHLPEFYYQVLPAIEEDLILTENQPELIARYLPPQAEFVFYLDAPDQDVTCRLRARYASREVSVLDVVDADQRGINLETFRSRQLEQEFLSRVSPWFAVCDLNQDELSCASEEEKIYQLMKDGVDAFMELGEVRCTDRFRKREGLRKIKASVGVSVSQGLLDLEITTDGISPEELLELLDAYRQKKKYHRLKDGSFVDTEDRSLEMLSELMDSLHMKPKDFVKGKLQIPAYRTLYLDRMLEDHESVYSYRDSHFRELVKSFKTINDSAFEEPKSLARIMRNYQKTGYKWLRTLEQWKFGGILADDMGLGKTLQAIALLLAAKEEGEGGTSLIICPASLVFNWGEEFSRFAPALTVSLITGTAAERRKKIRLWKDFDVLVTSYDLLKRDIVEYEEAAFRYEIIDEAQYIKNQTTAAAKTVKIVKSQMRFALTGTPIENRLSELWSIFDYLMPGFLYSYETFKKEMETPIVKNGDEAAAARLQKLVSPFILRRLKEEVLRDLPEKLEEVRYVHFEAQQQKLYDAQVLRMKEQIARQDAAEFTRNKLIILAELTRLRQICCDPSLCFENYQSGAAKIDACISLVQSAIDGGHRILLFSQFTSMLAILKEKLDAEGISCYTITGSTPKEQRLLLVRRFNTGDVPVFLISLKAGGVGLNLTGADIVIHYDPWWNFAAQNQATDRAHRIGQTKKVTVYRMIAKNTVEEKILKLQETKRDLAEQIIGQAGGEIGSMSREDLLELLGQ